MIDGDVAEREFLLKSAYVLENIHYTEICWR